MSTKKEVAKLEKMDLNKLQSEYAEVTGKKTRSPNRKFLVAKIAEALQVAGSRAGDRRDIPKTSQAASSWTTQREKRLLGPRSCWKLTCRISCDR